MGVLQNKVWHHFYVIPDHEIKLIQVSANLKNADTVKWEIRTLTDPEDIPQKARLRLLILDCENSLDIPADSGIEVTAIYEWLLGEYEGPWNLDSDAFHVVNIRSMLVGKNRRYFYSAGK